MKRRHKPTLAQRDISRAGTIIRIVLIRVAAVVFGVSLATFALFLIWNEIEARTRGGVGIGAAPHHRGGNGAWHQLDITNGPASFADHSNAVIAASPMPAVNVVQLHSGPGSPRLSSALSSALPPLLAPSQRPVTPTTTLSVVFSGENATSNAKSEASDIATGVAAGGPVTAASSEPWDALWHSPTGPVDPQYHSIIRGIVGSVAV